MIAALLGALICAAPAVPNLDARVTDLAGLLNPAEQQQLERSLQLYEQKTGHQFALLTIPTLDGYPIENYAIEVVEAWKLGDASRDDGLLFLVARDDKKMRIEVGYGLEGAIPDVLAGRIIRDYAQPYFRRGEFGAGIRETMLQLMRAAEGEALGQPPAGSQASRRGRGGRGSPFAALLPLLIFAGLVFRPLLFAAVLGFIGLEVLGVIGALVGGVMGLGLGLTMGVGRGPFIGGFGGGFGGGGFGGGGFGGGGFGGGGFGGGGGGFGGGGASGDW
ncbi:MAG: TPM domain-containing protein [Myxococcota bacterium]